jgi:hypothetical protein
VPALTGLGLFLCVALPWPVMMLATTPGVWRTWFDDVMRVDPADPRPSPWYASLQIFREFMPWTLWLVLGVAGAGRAAWRGERSRAELAFWLFVLPVVAMSCFSERAARYMLPVIPPGAVLAGWALVQVIRGAVPAGSRAPYLVVHGILVAALTIGGTIMAMPRGGGGPAWFTWPVASGIVGVMLALVVAGAILGRRREAALLVATAAAVLLFDVVHAAVFRPGDGRLSDMKPLADAIAAVAPPDAEVISVFPDNPDRNAPLDLSIYLNRVVRPVRSADAMARGENGAAAVVVVVGTTSSAAPREWATAGWDPIGAAARGPVRWHAFVSPAAMAPETLPETRDPSVQQELLNE